MLKTVLITGCSSGFGAAIAEVFHAEGWNVSATMRAPDRSPIAASERMLVTRLDVQDRGSIDAAVAASIARFGGVDVLVNNAGFSMLGVFEEIPRERLVEQLEVNVLGLMDVTRAVLPAMRARRSGVIVNISSGAGIYAVPMLSLYIASKFAVEGFSEALAYELATVGVKVKLVEPGAVLTTGFAARALSEAAGTSTIDDYGPFRVAMQKVFAGQGAVHGLATAPEVAQVVFDAATDGTDRLRYIAGNDIVPFVEARQQSSERDYIALMRKTFAVGW